MKNDSEKVKNLPFVSVIIPVYNDSGRLMRCLEALSRQSYSKDKYEVIVVDNGSTDNSKHVAQSFSGIVLEENDIQSSYAARNTGILHAKGELLAFTDSDCIPGEKWIESGVKALTDSSADIAGGKVSFTFSMKKTAAELLDSMVDMQIKENIEQRGVAKTANLFVRRTVFDTVGLFPSYTGSGGDVLWTGNATKRGLKLVYAENAEIHHPARMLPDLLKKQLRVGDGQMTIWLKSGNVLSHWFHTAKKEILFPFGKRKTSNGRENGKEKIPKTKLLKLGMVGLLCIGASNIGRMRVLVKKMFSPARSSS